MPPDYVANYVAAHNHLQQCVTAALRAADPARLVQANLSRNGTTLTIADQQLDVGPGRLFLISVGKAARPMGLAAAEILGPALYRGLILAPRDGDRPLDLPANVTLHAGDHPIASADNVAATAAIGRLLAETTGHDHVLCLISGGTSALLTQPRLPLPHWQALNHALLASGCDIQTFNQVRRFFDEVKGGGLARQVAPAACHALILSDVIGNDLAAIGSGPTVPIPADPDAVREILAKYDILTQLSPPARSAVTDVLSQPAATATISPPHNQIIGDLHLSAQAAAAALSEIGFTPRLLTTHLTGEAREIGRVAAALAQDLAPGHALLLGGETTVTLRGNGRGGRNQELVLAALLALRGQPRVLIASCASDGVDGPTDAAGAFITGAATTTAANLGLDAAAALADNDAYPFFQKLGEATTPAHSPPAGGLLQTGPTGTNVNDLLFIMRYD